MGKLDISVKQVICTVDIVQEADRSGDVERLHGLSCSVLLPLVSLLASESLVPASIGLS